MATPDLTAVAAIEAEGPSPWSAAMLAAELGRGDGWQWVAAPVDRPEAVCGFVCGRTCGEEAELFRIAVARGHRRQGAGERLLAHALGVLAGKGVRRCLLEVRAANQPALALYRKTGFVQIGRRRGYYSDPSDDAIVMEVQLSAPGEGAGHEKHQRP